MHGVHRAQAGESLGLRLPDDTSRLAGGGLRDVEERDRRSGLPEGVDLRFALGG
jgi:hypothetical protein